MSSTRVNVNGGSVNLTFDGESRLIVNGESGLPSDVVVSGGGRGDDQAPHYSAQNYIKVTGGKFDFTTAEPVQNLDNAYTRYWNTTAGTGSGTGEAFVVGLYHLKPDFNTLSGWGWALEESDGCALSIGGEVYLDDNGTLKPMVNAGVSGGLDIITCLLYTSDAADE